MDQIRQYIRQGQLREAIDRVVEFSAQASDAIRAEGFALENRYVDFRRGRLTGQLTDLEIRQTEQQLGFDVLRWISAWEKQSHSTEPSEPITLVQINQVEILNV